jgi:hypothetical protein
MNSDLLGDKILKSFSDSYIDILSNGKFGESNISIDSFDKNQIEKGIKVEFEHTKNRLTAKKITLDHLTEFFPLPYYDYLDDAEKKMRKDLAKNSSK